jgi:hypothetical protein
VVDALSGETLRCSRAFECDALLLGALMKEMKTAKLIPEPAKPFAGITVDGLRNTVRNFRSARFHNLGTCDLLILMRVMLSEHQRNYYVLLETFEVYYDK